jgi:hypothetical protein
VFDESSDVYREAKKHNYVATGKRGRLISQLHANLSGGDKGNATTMKDIILDTGKGKVLKGRMGYEDFHNQFEVDPDYGGLKSAKRSTKTVDAGAFKGSGLKSKTKYSKYLKNNKMRVAAGIFIPGSLAAGSVYKGLKAKGNS